MAPLSFFRGGGDSTLPAASSSHGGTGPSASTVTSTDAHYTRARTPDTNGHAAVEETTEPSPSRLNPARLLRRKNSRALKSVDRSQHARDRERERERDRDSESVDIRRSSEDRHHDSPVGHRKLGSHGSGKMPLVTPSSPTPGASAISQHPPLLHGSQQQPEQSPAISSISNFGSVRSTRSVKSDGSPGESEIIHIEAAPNHLGHPHPFLQRPLTPPPALPTALNPPQRPTRSPHPPPPPRGIPHSSRAEGHSASSSTSSGDPAVTPAHLRHNSASGSRPGSPLGDYDIEKELLVDRERTTDPATTAWLARRPSRTRKTTMGTPDRRLRRVESASSSTQASASGDSADEPATATPTHNPTSPPAQPQPSSSTNAPPSSFAPTTSFPTPTHAIHPHSAQNLRPHTPEKNGFDVSVVCTSKGDEVRWEVVLRRATTSTADVPPPGPITITNGETNAHAPAMASSVNLSLSLDIEQPSGKMVFISLPSDATPTRTRTRSISSPRAGSARVPLSFALRDAGARDSFGSFTDAPLASVLAPAAPMPNHREGLHMRNGGGSGSGLDTQSPRNKRQGAVWAPPAGDVFVNRNSISSSERSEKSAGNSGSFESARQSLDRPSLESAIEGIVVEE